MHIYRHLLCAYPSHPRVAENITNNLQLVLFLAQECLQNVDLLAHLIDELFGHRILVLLEDIGQPCILGFDPILVARELLEYAIVVLIALTGRGGRVLIDRGLAFLQKCDQLISSSGPNLVRKTVKARNSASQCAESTSRKSESTCLLIYELDEGIFVTARVVVDGISGTSREILQSRITLNAVLLRCFGVFCGVKLRDDNVVVLGKVFSDLVIYWLQLFAVATPGSCNVLVGISKHTQVVRKGEYHRSPRGRLLSSQELSSRKSHRSEQSQKQRLPNRGVATVSW